MRLALLIALLVLLRAPFFEMAIQGDDVNYIAAAQYAQIDPAHPLRLKFVFQGSEVSMQGHPHPPLNAWWLAGLLAAFGDVQERVFHAAYLVFSVIALAAMWSLAQRFAERPVGACLLFLTVPAFVINGTSLESDLPFLAFWLASIALFVRAVDAQSGRLLAGSSACMILAGLAAFQSLVIAPLLGLYLWEKRRGWRPGWAVLLTVPLTFAGWQLFERLTSEQLPAEVLTGYFAKYGLQRLENKARNAIALTTHLGWMVLPLAFAVRGKVWIVPGIALAAALAIDPHPLFAIPFACGAMVLAWCWQHRREWLAQWVLVFFGAALVLFFAGSARYLLPLAAPLCLLSSRYGWLAAPQGALALALAFSNAQFWNGYREIPMPPGRTYIDGEFGLRFYGESRGGLPLIRNQIVRAGEWVLQSKLGAPVPHGTAGTLRVIERREIGAPLCLIGLQAKSGYSDASRGFRAFDLCGGPADVVTASTVVERKPELSFVDMKAAGADEQIVSGIGSDRWMFRRGVLALKPSRGPVEVTVYIPEQAPARTVTLTLDGAEIARQTLPGPGMHVVRSGEAEGSTLTVEVDRTFRVGNDERDLGLILVSAGFR